MYMVVNPDTKRKQNKIFLEFLKYWLGSRDFNKLVIKAKVHAKTFFLWRYNMIFLERLGRVHENKNF